MFLKKIIKKSGLECVSPHDRLHAAHWGVEDADQEDDEARNVHLEPCHLQRYPYYLFHSNPEKIVPGSLVKKRGKKVASFIKQKVASSSAIFFV
jgi:hypothetical protein